MIPEGIRFVTDASGKRTDVMLESSAGRAYATVVSRTWPQIGILPEQPISRVDQELRNLRANCFNSARALTRGGR